MSYKVVRKNEAYAYEAKGHYDRINDAFFLSQVMNEMILLRRKVLLHTIPASRFHPLKDEMQLAQYVMALKEGEGA